MLAHNVETVPRIFKRIRPGFRFERSLAVITAAREAGLVTKSNLILGMGEEPHEVVETMQALHDAGCDLLTITQYLRPVAAAPPGRPLGEARRVRRASRPRPSRSASPASWPGPLVRSSYRAGRLYQQAIEARGLTHHGLTRHLLRVGACGRRGPPRPYPGGMARSKPTDATAPGGKAGRGPNGGRGRSGDGRGKAPKLDKNGQPKVGRLKKIAGQVGMIKQAYTLTRKNDPQAPVDHADRLRGGRRPWSS